MNGPIVPTCHAPPAVHDAILAGLKERVHKWAFLRGHSMRLSINSDEHSVLELRLIQGEERYTRTWPGALWLFEPGLPIEAILDSMWSEMSNPRASVTLSLDDWDVVTTALGFTSDHSRSGNRYIEV